MQDETGPGPSAALRADARRNHDALLTAAAAVFDRAGVDAPIKVIADAAGVGVATLYRRFPTRSDLVVAVLRREVELCARAAETLAADHPPLEALRLWIDRLIDLIATKRGLAAALRSGAPAYADLRAAFEARLVPPLEGLMAAAAAEIRADVSARDLWRAVALLCAPDAPGDFDLGRRMAGLLIAGLRAGERGD